MSAQALETLGGQLQAVRSGSARSSSRPGRPLGSASVAPGEEGAGAVVPPKRASSATTTSAPAPSSSGWSARARAPPGPRQAGADLAGVRRQVIQAAVGYPASDTRLSSTRCSTLARRSRPPRSPSRYHDRPAARRASSGCGARRCRWARTFPSRPAPARLWSPEGLLWLVTAKFAGVTRPLPLRAELPPDDSDDRAAARLPGPWPPKTSPEPPSAPSLCTPCTASRSRV